MLLGRGGEGLIGLRDGHEAVAGGAVGVAGAGTALTAGLGAKVAIGCAGAAMAVLCAGPLGALPTHQPAPAKRVVAAKHERQRHSTAKASVAAAAPRTPAVDRVPSRGRADGERAAAGPRPAPHVDADGERAGVRARVERPGDARAGRPPPPPAPAANSPRRPRRRLRRPNRRASAPSSSFGGEFSP